MLRKQEQLPPDRKAPASAAELSEFRKTITGEIKHLLQYEKTDQPLNVRHLVTTPRKGYQVEKLEFVSEAGIYIPTWVFVPGEPDRSAPATLFVDEAGKEAEGQEFGLLEKLALKGRLVIAVDVRGIGETRPPHPDNRGGGFAHLFDVQTAMAYMAWFMDESLFGMRVRDVVRSVDYALSRPDVKPASLRVAGKGAGALWALYAAALDPRITEVVAEGGLASYRSLAQVDRYRHGAHIFIRDVLLHFDIPHVAAAAASRRLTLVSPVDPMMNVLGAAEARRIYDWTAQTYKNAGAEDRFRLVHGSLGEQLL